MRTFAEYGYLYFHTSIEYYSFNILVGTAMISFYFAAGLKLRQLLGEKWPEFFYTFPKKII
jgi:hypothetical protein